MQSFPASPRRTHRKRASALRLSSDTTATLPEYIPTGGWDRDPETPSDLPPEYTDSAEEADEDTDDTLDHSKRSPYVAQFTGLHSPRSARPKRHRRKPSSPSTSDLYLDSLLERSVHALEMSNALLQSSMSTQNTLSNVFSAGSPSDSTLEVRARGLSSRITNDRDMHEVWADDLAEIGRDVERLFGDGSPEEQPMRTRKESSTGSISSSVPLSAAPIGHYRRRPSLDFRSTAPEAPHLRYDTQERPQLVAHPPRALTQYVVVDANGEPDPGIVLPSTLGLRSAASHHAAPSSPIVTDKLPEPSTRAYNMLSSFVTRSNSSSSSKRPSRRGSNSSSAGQASSTSSRRQSKRNSPERSMSISRSTSSRSSSQSRRSKSATSNLSPYAGPSGSSSSSSLTITSSNNNRPNSSNSNVNGSPHRSHSPYYTNLPHTHSHPHSHSHSHSHNHPRPMTPPQEESSSSSSDACHAKQTISALRKILDEQPPPPPKKPRPSPALMKVRTAQPIEAGTSTATASISRLFTKPTHTSSTRPPSPPRVSSMKGKGRLDGEGHSRGGSLSLPVSLNGSRASPVEVEGGEQSQSALSTPGASTSTFLTVKTTVPTPAPASTSATGLPTPSSMSFSDMFGAVSAALSNSNGGSGSVPRTPNTPMSPTSATPSGMSTPKRISFMDPVDGRIRASGRNGKGRGRTLIDSLMGMGIGVGSGNGDKDKDQDKDKDKDNGDSATGSGSGTSSTKRRRKNADGSGNGSVSRNRKNSRKSGHRRHGSGSGSISSRDENSRESWWMGWLMGASGAYGPAPGTGSGSTMRPGLETRGFGSAYGSGSGSGSGRLSGYSSGLDDWTV
ncbi:hypothetical protein D9758_004180 [Tetrapyrgos nigripes]|uniref:Uncharacterized protein n=1 Tax=Tetrapyrgos nigripes TaxID=182062 RepID=A0A8H5LVB7_9AGAR|nr:hypothetical protein D9758_004180 [Tetrapyrgos nigripes]